jgi:hypothetical protein
MAQLPLRTRQDFFDVLAETEKDAARFARKTPGYPPFGGILRQLRTMQGATANGRTPSADERDSISIGLIAIRELDPEHSDEMADFIDRLHELNGYFREWPPDP